MSSNAIGRAGGTEASPRPRVGVEAGLSIVVPVYNEAAGLGALHGRIVEVARRLRASTGCWSRSSMWTTAAATPRWRSRARCRPTPSIVQVVSLSRNFGKEAALLGGPRSRPPRRRAVHGRRRSASADPGRDARRRIGSMTATTWSTPPRPTARTSRWLRRFGVKAFYLPDQLGRAAEDSGGCRRLPPALAARRRGAAAAARAQPVLQGVSRAGSAFARSGSTTSRPNARMAAAPGTSIR